MFRSPNRSRSCSAGWNGWGKKEKEEGISHSGVCGWGGVYRNSPRLWKSLRKASLCASVVALPPISASSSSSSSTERSNWTRFSCRSSQSPLIADPNVSSLSASYSSSESSSSRRASSSPCGHWTEHHHHRHDYYCRVGNFLACAVLWAGFCHEAHRPAANGWVGGVEGLVDLPEVWCWSRKTSQTWWNIDRIGDTQTSRIERSIL